MKRAAFYVVVVLASIMFAWQAVKTVMEIRNFVVEWSRIRKLKNGASRPPTPIRRG